MCDYQSLNAEDARAIAVKALELAEYGRQKISISVVDSKGRELCFMTMDSAFTRSRAAAKNKAYLAVTKGKKLSGSIILKNENLGKVVGAVAISGLSRGDNTKLVKDAFRASVIPASTFRQLSIV